jgi:hypothetical protein
VFEWTTFDNIVAQAYKAVNKKHYNLNGFTNKISKKNQ